MTKAEMTEAKEHLKSASPDDVDEIVSSYSYRLKQLKEGKISNFRHLAWKNALEPQNGVVIRRPDLRYMRTTGNFKFKLLLSAFRPSYAAHPYTKKAGNAPLERGCNRRSF